MKVYICFFVLTFFIVGCEKSSDSSSSVKKTDISKTGLMEKQKEGSDNSYSVKKERSGKLNFNIPVLDSMIYYAYPTMQGAESVHIKYPSSWKVLKRPPEMMIDPWSVSFPVETLIVSDDKGITRFHDWVNVIRSTSVYETRKNNFTNMMFENFKAIESITVPQEYQIPNITIGQEYISYKARFKGTDVEGLMLALVISVQDWYQPYTTEEFAFIQIDKTLPAEKYYEYANTLIGIASSISTTKEKGKEIWERWANILGGSDIASDSKTGKQYLVPSGYKYHYLEGGQIKSTDEPSDIPKFSTQLETK